VPLGESLEELGLVVDDGVVEEEGDGVDVDPPIELEPVEPKLLVLDGVLPKLLVLL